MAWNCISGCTVLPVDAATSDHRTSILCGNEAG